jgi:hypothetical protein
LGGTAGILADFQGGLSLSLLVLDGKVGAGKAAEAVFIASPEAQKAVPAPLEGSVQGGEAGGARSSSALVAAMGADGPGELVLYDTSSGARSYPLRAGASWIALDLQGPKDPLPDKEHSNRNGVGSLVEVRAGARRIILEASGGAGGSARASSRVYSGLRGAGSADYARVLWPDGVLQMEQGLAGGRVHSIREEERKPSSCPILFAWTGKGFEFVGDFLGVGGLGYFETPGVYSRPDPTEFVSLPDLRPLEGSYRLEILEPLEECAYLDEVKLVVVDHPAGVTVLPQEMFAVKGPPPDLRLLALEEKVFPIRASDGEKNDVTIALLEVDRRYGNSFQPDPRFPGLARRPHVLELEFAGRIGKLLESQGESAGPFLFLHGFVEYGYSTSNFAAWQAGKEFHAPSFQVERGGKWVTLREEWGFPAGYPRYMAVDLNGLLERSDQKLRIETNMDIRWDQAFLASARDADSAAAQGLLTITELSMDGARLDFMGFPPEESPDGSVPALYVHRDFRPAAPFKIFPGAYTRYGEAGELLSAADDRFAVFGPGDGLRLTLHESRLPPLAAGRGRAFFLKARGYCKDMDLYTAHPESVEPLPFGAMSGYPYDRSPPAKGEEFPPFLEAYRRKWNTRLVTGTWLDGLPK